MSRLGEMTNKITSVFLIGLGALWLATAFGHGFWSWIWKTSLALTIGIISASQVGLMTRTLEKEIDRVSPLATVCVFVLTQRAQTDCLSVGSIRDAPATRYTAFTTNP